MLVMVPFYFPDSCRTSIYECLKMWSQAPLMREIMLCLSGSCLLHSIWSFLIPFIYLQSLLFHFYSKLLFHALYIQYFYCWVLWAHSGSYGRLICSFWDFSILIFIVICHPAIPTTVNKGLLCLHLLWHLLLVIFVDFDHYNLGKMKSQRYYDFHYPNC